MKQSKRLCKRKILAAQPQQEKAGFFLEPSYGALFVLKQVAEKLGITQALGESFPGKCALWQVFVRVFEKGSSFLANTSATLLFKLPQPITENDLETSLLWVAEEQKEIEKRLQPKPLKKKSLLAF